MKPLPFQVEFIRRAMDARVACFSAPRGNGKSFLGGVLVSMAPPKLERHHEVVLIAGSIEQARIVFRFARHFLGEDGYRYLDSSTRYSITSPASAKLRVIGSNPKTTMGLVNCAVVIADEPGAWNQAQGALM